jgi:DegV family protein with EDD domain
MSIMDKVRIITDSNAYLSPAAIEQYRIQVIPHRIRASGDVADEKLGHAAEELFRRLPSVSVLPQGQLPQVLAADVNRILELYQTTGREAEQIMSIHMSSQLSPMWQQARRAAEMLKGRYTIRVIDSMSTSFGLGLLVEMAAQAAAAGANVHEIARIVNGAVPHLYVSVFSESLNYLERSAQLSASQSLLGTLLGIKAMLMMEEGRLQPLEKVQTREEVVEKLYDFVAEFANVERVGVLHHEYSDSCAALIERLQLLLPRATIQTVNYPSSLGVHLGPHMLGVVVYEGMQ